MKEQINKLLSIGATGTVNHFFQWLRMLQFLNQETLPEKFADFQSQYENHLKNYESNLIPDEIEVFAYEGKKNFSHYLSQNIIKLTGTFLLDIWIFT